MLMPTLHSVDITHMELTEQASAGMQQACIWLWHGSWARLNTDVLKVVTIKPHLLIPHKLKLLKQMS